MGVPQEHDFLVAVDQFGVEDEEICWGFESGIAGEERGGIDEFVAVFGEGERSNGQRAEAVFGEFGVFDDSEALLEAGANVVSSR